MITTPLVRISQLRREGEPRFSGSNCPGLSKVLSAAVVNRAFRETLLRDPASALKQGYQGEVFGLSDEEKALLSKRFDSLRDLATRIIVAYQQ